MIMDLINARYFMVRIIDALVDGPTSFIIVYILYAVYFGIKTQLLGESKGYDKGFLWGFFLGIIGWFIVKDKPVAEVEDTYLWEKDAAEEEKREQEILSKGGWRCPKCNQVNASYVTTCVCGEGRSKLNKMIYKDK